jgi:hypothetical protein
MIAFPFCLLLMIAVLILISKTAMTLRSMRRRTGNRFYYGEEIEMSTVVPHE